MAHKIHKGLLLLLLFVALWLLVGIATFSDVGLANRRAILELQTPTPTVTPTVAPTITPTSTPMEPALITITVRLSSTQLVVGDLLPVSVHIDNQPRTCSFSMYDLTLRQPFSATQMFRFLSPERLGPPAPTDAEFTLQAINPGVGSLTAVLYGEEYCGFWQWSYRYGTSSEIVIAPSLTPITSTSFYLPSISR